MLNQTLALKHKQIDKETKQKIMVKMRVRGMSNSAIIEILQDENTPEEEIKKMLEDQK